MHAAWLRVCFVVAIWLTRGWLGAHKMHCLSMCVCECVRCSAKSNSETGYIGDRRTSSQGNKQRGSTAADQKKETKAKATRTGFLCQQQQSHNSNNSNNTQMRGNFVWTFLYFRFTFNDFGSCGGVGGESARGKGGKATATQKSKWWTER